MIQGKDYFLEWNNTGHGQIWEVERGYRMTLSPMMTGSEESGDGGISQAPGG